MIPATGTDTRTDLDAQTVEELQPVCERTAVIPYTADVTESCDQPAAYIVRYTKPCRCGRRTVFLCGAHVGIYFGGMGFAMSTCSSCLARFQTSAVVVLSVEPIGGTR